MSLSIKQLQTRSRAFYASTGPIQPLPSTLPFRTYVNRVVMLKLARARVLVEIDALPVASPARPMSALASSLFSIACPPVRTSDVFRTYSAIECAPSVGCNLSARA